MKLNPEHYTTLAGIFGLGALNLLLQSRKNVKSDREEENSMIPLIELSNAGFCKSVEVFGDYVVRQIGLGRSSAVGKRLAVVAEGYLRGDKSHLDRSLEGLFIFLSKACPEMADEEMERLNQELVKELDACMLAYFSFHWHHSAALLDQVQSGENKLRKVVMSATRKQRFQHVMKTLKTQRTFSTLVDQLKAIHHNRRGSLLPDDKTVVVPAECHIRSPVLLLIGGGMGAGKSTVVKDILDSPFWSAVAQDAVVVEADAFKETDVIYRALSTLNRGDVAEAAQLVHQSSTNAASSLLVAALNEGRDVIFDGTLSWEPFVVQTLAMARDVHRRRYRMGPGYRTTEDGGVEERYWEALEEEEEEKLLDLNSSGQNAIMHAMQEQEALPTSLSGPSSGLRERETSSSSLSDGSNEDLHTSREEKAFTTSLSNTDSRKSSHGVRERKPYRIELVGVTCDAQLAVVRGIRRAILTKRAVPVKGQLRSHKLFAESLEKYCELVDQVKIYSTSCIGGPAELIGWKDGRSKLLVDCESFKAVKNLSRLNPSAGSVLELYDDVRFNRVWHQIVVSSERSFRQELLRKELGSENLAKSIMRSSTLSSSFGSSSSDVGSSSFSSQPSDQDLTAQSSTSDFGSFSSSSS
ncbi:hypothetical protein O6H91_Y128600 [Diphasiastrum complanatum]|nr:hypothetical protein O6H91_Y128600 [Diphasiastrum complanatum]